MLKVIGFSLLLITLIGCNDKRELTPEEVQEVGALRTELESSKADLNDALDEYEKYSGGLVKDLLKVRIEVSKLNKSLIEQRIKAIEYGAPITESVPSYSIDPERAKALREEIEGVEAEIAANRKEAERYSGGLILATKLSSIATQEQSLAMLKHQYLQSKYGLGGNIVGASSSRGDVNIDSATTNDGKKAQHDSHSEPESNEVEDGAIKEPKSQKSEEVTKTPPADGPFGIKMGLSKSEIEAMMNESLESVPDNPGLYFSSIAPKPNSKFEDYVYIIGDVSGLCGIRGIGETINTNGYGTSLKTEYSSLQSLLEEIYGEYEEIDRLLPGSIWDDPSDWMMSLRKKDRYLLSQWTGGESGLPHNLKNVGISANATGSSEGYILIEYSFKNADDCSSESQAVDKDSL